MDVESFLVIRTISIVSIHVVGVSDGNIELFVHYFVLISGSIKISRLICNYAHISV